MPSGEIYFGDRLEPGSITTFPAVQDALLQSGAIILPPGYLPTSAAELRIYRQPTPGEELHCRVVVQKTEEGYRGDLTVWDMTGALVETFRDLTLKGTEGAAAARLPTSEPRSLVDVANDLRTLRPAHSLALAIAGHTEVSDGVLSSELSRSDRDRVAMDVAEPRRTSALANLLATRRAAADFGRTQQTAMPNPGTIQLASCADGKPALRMAGCSATVLAESDVTLADGAGLSVSMIGPAPVGIDIEPVVAHDCETWRGLLGMDGYDLALHVERETGDSFDRAATRVWCLLEAGKKAHGPERPMPAFHCNLGSLWLSFRFGQGESSVEFLSAIARHPEQPEVMLALAIAIPTIKTRQESSEQTLAAFGYDASGIGIAATNDGPRDQFVFHHKFPVTFRSAQSLGGHVYFTNYADWLGTIRELSLAPVRSGLTDTFVGGVFALATNHFYMRVWGDARVDDTVEARLWADAISPDGAVIDLSVEWSKVLPGRAAEPIAYAAMRASYIEITGHGEARLSPPPDFLRTFFQNIAPQTTSADAYDIIDDYHRRTEDMVRGAEVSPSRRKAEGYPLLHEEHFQTSLEDSNVVGNVYFSNYSKWLGRTRDLYFHKNFPTEFGPSGRGEWFLLLCDIDHLQEAMPFDQVAVRMNLDRLFERGLDLRFELFQMNDGVLGKKLAVARTGLVWVPRKRSSPHQSEPVPASVLAKLSGR